MNARPAAVVVRHNFETAHRLPFLGGKCTNLHGHSWWAEVTVSGGVNVHGVLLEFAALKAHVRGWIDTHLDHGAMLGWADPLLVALYEHGSKTFVFDPDEEVGASRYCAARPWGRALEWPTVENTAELLRRMVADHLAATAASTPARPLHVAVRVTETHVNEAVAQ